MFLKDTELSKLTIEENVTAISQDSYDEVKIMEAVKSADVEECSAIAWQFTINGMGNRTLGQVKIGETVWKIEDLCQRNNILYNISSSAKLEPDTLTIKRLARLFRFAISKKIKKTNSASFLWKKYADPASPCHLIFPCAEYMINQENEHWLLDAYANLDEKLNTTFEKKITVILKARKSSHRT
jgi:hypothetical protein